MANRVRQPNAEKRTERTAVRWTPTEMGRIKEAQERLHLQYEVDVVRTLALKQLDFDERLRSRSGDLELAAKTLGTSSMEDLLFDLAFRQLDLISSALEKDVAQ
ncbi:hypothetical protein ACFW2V_12785 [Streptomyces sp. NPDC058947]|uniref:hypothetical protein n=1 Tax=Streptomyces sp. NPDC058947 TaxID=3346675 RepID=UPI00368DE636